MAKAAIDFTRMRKGTRTSGSRRIDYCPRCGRKGEKAVYIGANAGDVSYVHNATLADFPFEHRKINDSCYIKKGG